MHTQVEVESGQSDEPSNLCVSECDAFILRVWARHAFSKTTHIFVRTAPETFHVSDMTADRWNVSIGRQRREWTNVQIQRECNYTWREHKPFAITELFCGHCLVVGLSDDTHDNSVQILWQSAVCGFFDHSVQDSSFAMIYGQIWRHLCGKTQTPFHAHCAAVQLSNT